MFVHDAYRSTRRQLQYKMPYQICIITFLAILFASVPSSYSVSTSVPLVFCFSAVQTNFELQFELYKLKTWITTSPASHIMQFYSLPLFLFQ